jgi:hypothetical protein
VNTVPLFYSIPEVGKVTFKSNGDEVLSDESLKKSNGNEAFNDNFFYIVTAMKPLMLGQKL